MTLRQKILLIVGATLVSLIAVLYTTSSTALLNTSLKLEQQETREHVKRVQKALAEEINQLDLMAANWAKWDEAYTFVENSNRSYINNNFNKIGLAGINLNLVIFTNSSNRIVYSKFFDPSCQKCLPIASDFQQYLINSSLLHDWDKNRTTGLILLHETPVLIAARPLDTDSSGARRGILILGRYLNALTIERLAECTQLNLNLYAVDDPRMPADFRAVRSSLLHRSQILVRPLNEQTIAGYTIFKDIYGQPAVIIGVRMPRDIYQHDRVSVRYLFLSVLAASIVSIAVTLVLLEQLVFSRLSNLSSNVRSLSWGDPVPQEIPLIGKDELSSLADAINNMLRVLADSQHQQQEREERYYKYSKILTKLAKHQTAENSDLNARFREITEAAASTLEVEYASVWLYRPGNRKLLCANLYQCSTAQHTAGIEWQASDYPAYFKAIRQERAVATADVCTEPKTKKMSERFLSKFGISAMVNAPIYINGKIVGIVCHAHKEIPRRWLIEEQNFTASIANLVALALAAWERQRSQIALQTASDELETKIRERTGELAKLNQELRAEILECQIAEEKLIYQASHDPLTGLANRTLFMQQLESAIARTKQEHCLLAVLFIDLDRFKSINDTLGHLVGDELLSAIAYRLQACLRPGDVVARLGGDEFTILLENIKNKTDATQVADRIQRELKVPFHLSGRQILTTASIGIAFSDAGYERSEDLLHVADITMYRAKTSGKGCYEVFN